MRVYAIDPNGGTPKPRDLFTSSISIMTHRLAADSVLQTGHWTVGMYWTVDSTLGR